MSDSIPPTSLRFADLLCRRSGVIIVLLVAATGCSLLLLRSLRFDFTPQAIYRGDDELVEYSEQFKQTFGYDEAVILVVLQSMGDQDVLSADALTWQAEIAGDFSSVPEVIRIDSLSTLEFPHRSLMYFRLEPVVDKVPVTKESAERARELLHDTELVYYGLLSHDDKV